MIRYFFILASLFFSVYLFADSVSLSGRSAILVGTVQSVPVTISCSTADAIIYIAGDYSGAGTFSNSSLVGSEIYVQNESSYPQTISFSISYGPPSPPSHESQYGHPLNSCPQGCGVCLSCTPGHSVWNSQLERLVYGCETLPGGGGGGGDDDDDNNDAPWARESSLQSLISGFSTFGNTWAQWAQSISGKVDTANQSLSGIQNQLTSINSQQINNQQTFASYMDSLFNSYLNPLKDKSDIANGHLNDLKGKADTANGHLNDLKGTADTANGHLNDLKGQADTANGHLTGLNQKAAITNQNVSDTRQFTEQIKNSLNPSNVTAPTMETPLDDITPNTSTVTNLKNKLLPRYSFFTNPAGSAFPEWSFTLPLQSLGWRDFTITLGGSAWSTVGGGVLVRLMQFVRTLSKFVFYFIFLRCIILYLRQW